MSGSLLEPRPSFLHQIRSLAALHANGLRDTRRFWRSSFTGYVKSQENLRARIAISLHFLEYGNALAGSAPGHGLDRALMLAADLETYIARFGPDATTEIALRTLESYLAVNEDSGLDIAAVEEVIARHEKSRRTGLRGGVETVTAQDIRSRAMIDFLSFAEARHSIRTYEKGPVALPAIENAVRAAQQSPSSCNRQTCRAYVWTDPEAVAEVLSLQSGNRGFGDQLGGVAVITSDLSHWENAHERYQAWVDGGMFAMSFVYGLHAEGLGSVMLNWSVTHDQDRKLRALTGLQESDLVITMVGFGLLPEKLKVPVSQRKPLDYALIVNQPLVSTEARA
jgi:nitroreductase